MSRDSHHRKSKYYILMIVTDGSIDDLEETIDQIVKASFLPLSIIIVGVGDDNFDSMDMYFFLVTRIVWMEMKNRCFHNSLT